MENKQEQIIVFYDGDCPFCNKSVEYVLKRNPPQNLRAAPLAGSTAKSLLPENLLLLDTLILIKDARTYTFSSAAIRTIAMAGRLQKIILVFFIIPKFIRDFVYRIIARNRRRLIKKECDVSQGQCANLILP